MLGRPTIQDPRWEEGEVGEVHRVGFDDYEVTITFVPREVEESDGFARTLGFHVGDLLARVYYFRAGEWEQVPDNVLTRLKRARERVEGSSLAEWPEDALDNLGTFFEIFDEMIDEFPGWRANWDSL